MDGLTGGRGSTAVELRPGRPDDAEVCGRICYEAFGAIADTHGFPSDFASLQVGLDVLPGVDVARCRAAVEDVLAGRPSPRKAARK